MPSYWLDSDILIDAKNRYYAFDILPEFWVFIETKAIEGVVASSTLVYDELLKIDDELAAWARQRQDIGLFIEPSPQVQTTFSAISDHVQQSYPAHRAAEFLGGADPWLIAQAKVDGGSVVTREIRVALDAKKVKIPNVCAAFAVPVKDLWTMLRELNASFGQR